jgi:acyl carrier protein
MDVRVSTLEAVKDVIGQTLGIGDRARALSAESPLFGGIPELDSFAVVELAAGLEGRFGFVIEDDDFSPEIFDTVGSLAAFVDRNLR